MHIPTCGTAEQEILSFGEALEQALRPSPDYDCTQWLYVPNRYCDYRYILGTAGTKPLICIGVNPSTAAPGDLDPTLKSVERIALGNGYNSFLMFNLYPQRATRPDDMERTCNDILRRENAAAFRWALEQTRGGAPAVWAAWGAVIEKRDYLADCLADLAEIAREMGARWYCAGPRSKKGHPHHPLYLRKDSPLEPFCVEEYIQTCL